MFSPEWVAVAVTIAVQLIQYGAIKQLVRDHERRIRHIESKIDKWQDEGFPATVRKAQSAHGGL